MRMTKHGMSNDESDDESDEFVGPLCQSRGFRDSQKRPTIVRRAKVVSSGAWNFKRAGYDAMHLLRSCCCYYDNTLRRAVTDTKSHRFTYSARAGAIERDCQGWLQQTPSRS